MPFPTLFSVIWQTPPEQKFRRDWAIVVFALLIAYLLSFAQRQLPAVVAAPLADDFGLRDAGIGALHGASFGIIYGLLALSGGWCADRFPRVYLIGVSLFVAGLATLISAAAQSVEQLWFLRAIVAAAQALLVPTAFSILGSHVPRRLSGLGVAGFATGPFLGSSLGYFVTYGVEKTGWQQPFVLFGMAGMAFATVIFLMRDRLSDLGNHTSLCPTGPRQTMGSVGFVLAAMTFTALAGHAVLAWTVLWLERSGQFDSKAAALLFAVALGVFGSIGALLSGRISDIVVARGLPRLVAQSAAAGVAASLALIVYQSDDTELMPIWLCGLVMGYAGAHVLGSTALQDAVPQHLRGRYHGLAICLINFVALGTGPLLVGIASDTHGSSEGLGTILSFFVPGALAIAAACGAIGARFQKISPDSLKNRSPA